jgi:SPP1 family predicted phage head-tail adaptor
MRGGRLRKRVILQRPVETQGDTGGVTISWVDVATVWAGVEPLRGREYESARAQNAETTHRIVLRFRDDIQRTWRLRLQNSTRYYRIDEMLNIDERNREVQIRATELEG